MEAATLEFARKSYFRGRKPPYQSGRTANTEREQYIYRLTQISVHMIKVRMMVQLQYCLRKNVTHQQTASKPFLDVKRSPLNMFTFLASTAH